MGPSRRERRRLARCRWGHTVRTGYRAARRDHPARRRLERHFELGVGGAAGGPTWLLYYRSRESISVPTLVIAEAHPRAVWPQRWRWCHRLDPLTSYVACSRRGADLSARPPRGLGPMPAIYVTSSNRIKKWTARGHGLPAPSLGRRSAGGRGARAVGVVDHASIRALLVDAGGGSRIRLKPR
jgi:hypothetical protein